MLENDVSEDLLDADAAGWEVELVVIELPGSMSPVYVKMRMRFVGISGPLVLVTEEPGTLVFPVR